MAHIVLSIKNDIEGAAALWGEKGGAWVRACKRDDGT